MSLEMVRDLYEYHWWANRQLFEIAMALGHDPVTREVGSQFSFPTLKGMLAHLYGADWLWLSRWKGSSPLRLPGDADFGTLAGLRGEWDTLESEQRGFLAELTPDRLDAVVTYRSFAGREFRAPLRALLQHVPNHATHHRSELATMLTMIHGSPPDTGFHTFTLLRTNQA